MALVVKVCGLTRLEDALGARDAMGPTRGDGHTITPEDIRLFETGL